MADVAITPGNVLKSAQGSVADGIAGATIVAGQALYIDSTAANVLKLADSDGSSPANTCAGIALHGSLVGQPIRYVTTDPAFQFGGTVAVGQVLYLSDTPGGITVTFADLEAGDVIIVLGVAVTTTTINLRPLIGGTL